MYLSVMQILFNHSGIDPAGVKVHFFLRSDNMNNDVTKLENDFQQLIDRAELLLTSNITHFSKQRIVGLMKTIEFNAQCIWQEESIINGIESNPFPRNQYTYPIGPIEYIETLPIPF